MKKVPTFALGLIVGGTLTAGGAVAATSYLQATPKTVKFVVDNKQSSVSAMNVNNKLYVPVRDVGNSFGYSVSGVTSNTVTFTEGKTVTTNSVGAGTSTGSTATTKTRGEYVEDLHDKYSTDGKLDSEKIKAGITAGEITVNVQDKETGDSLFQMIVKENNFAAYSVIKSNSFDLNLKNKKGETVLHTTVMEQNGFYFGELTNYFNVKDQYKDNEGKYPIDYAIKNSSFYVSLSFIEKS